jgi:hypothetical protein
LVTVITLAVPYVALGAGAAFRSSGRISSSHRQHSFSHRFHRFGFFGGDGLDGLDDQDAIIIQQVQPAPSTEPNPPKTASTFRHTGWMVVTECRSYCQVTGPFRIKRQSINPRIPS